MFIHHKFILLQLIFWKHIPYLAIFFGISNKCIYLVAKTQILVETLINNFPSKENQVYINWSNMSQKEKEKDLYVTVGGKPSYIHYFNKNINLFTWGANSKCCFLHFVAWCFTKCPDVTLTNAFSLTSTCWCEKKWLFMWNSDVFKIHQKLHT